MPASTRAVTDWEAGGLPTNSSERMTRQEKKSVEGWTLQADRVETSTLPWTWYCFAALRQLRVCVDVDVLSQKIGRLANVQYNMGLGSGLGARGREHEHVR